jgi:hypothetical protein
MRILAVYHVDIPEDDEYLLWDKTLGGQHKKVRDSLDAALARLGTSLQEIADIVFDSGDVSKLTGQRIYEKSAEFTSDRDASMAFHDSGIAGIKYLDSTSRNQGDGSFNYVVFDDSRVSITAYEQGADAGPRGRFIPGAPGERGAIELFQAATSRR